jgi:hypothetical protein
MVLPRIGAGLDGDELIGSLVVGTATATAEEIGIERRVMLVARVVIAAGGVALPDLDQRLRHRLAALVEHAAMHHDALAERLARALPGEIVLQSANALAGEGRSGDFGQTVRQRNCRLARRAQCRRPVFRRQVERVLPRGGPTIGVVDHELRTFAC